MLKKPVLLCVALLLLSGGPLVGQEEMYAARRQSLMSSLEGGFAVLFSDAPTGDFNKPFYYLTGIKDPGAGLVLIPGGDVEEVLFHPSAEWSYALYNTDARVHPSDAMAMELSRYIRGRDLAFASFRNLEALPGVSRALARVSTLRSIDNAIAEMRVIKDDHEIEFLSRACEVTAQGLNDVFRAVEAGMQEEDLAAMLEYGFKIRKSPGYSFLQAASGPNGTNVHFGAGERVLEDGDVIVFDVGAWWNNYTADISRTIPVSGTFTKEQREIYTVVLNSQKAAIEVMKPGADMGMVRDVAQNVLIDGLHELGLVLDKENELQRRFFIAHGYYHFIGLDIHDVWSETSRDTYKPGMVMTMEPGLYFPEDRLESALARLGPGEEDAEMRSFLEAIRPVFEKYVNIGVRIEDDVLITETGNEILTASVPKEIDEIEAMMDESGPLRRIRQEH